MRLVLAILALVGAGCVSAAAEPVPLPRPRPAAAIAPPSTATLLAGLGEVSSAPTPCDGRLARMAEFKPLPRLIGPGACGGPDMVEVDAVRTPGKRRIAIQPAAVLNCTMAESLAGWLRDEAAPRVAKLGSALAAIENYDSYECRSRNRVPGAKLSEHAHGDALDVRAFRLADGRRLELADAKVDLVLRQGLRDSACHRFTTVLGPGADGYHSGHVHLDVIQRRAGYRICQWDVRPPALAPVPLPRPRPVLAQAH